jgi:DNA-binding XRE family transcriptional regulator
MPTLTRLRELREHAMLTQDDLAKRAKVSPVTVLHAEHGRRINFKTAHKLAAALDTTPQRLAGIEEARS